MNPSARISPDPFRPVELVETIPAPAQSSTWNGSGATVNRPKESGLDVAACVQRVRRRDEEAARELMNHLYPLVLKLVRAHLPRRTSEEDLTQIVFMKVFANLDRYSGTVPLEHWVSRIAVNACLTQLRAEHSRPELRRADLTEDQCRVLESIAVQSDDWHPGDALASREIVQRLLASLPPADRLLLTLLHLEERSIEEIRKVTGWNSTLIRVRAHRARHRLRKTFGRLMREDRL